MGNVNRMSAKKDNVFTLLASVTAGACLLAATFYLAHTVRRDRAVTAQLQSATDALQSLAKRDPSPNRENISAAEREGKRIGQFVQQVQTRFQSAPGPEKLNSMELRGYIDNTVAELNLHAKHAGVEVPADYWFSFAAQKGTMAFSAGSLPLLAAQVADVRALCTLLFDTKVNALAWVKRVHIDGQDALGSQDYLVGKPQTNRWTVTLPYELAFQGFSSDLAHVLDRLAQSPQAFVVTNIVVEHASGAESQSSDQRPLATVQAGTQDSAAVPLPVPDRYRRYAPVQAPKIVATPQGPRTILKEELLRFTLSIQAVRLRLPEASLASNEQR